MEYYVHLSDETIKALKEQDGSDSGGGDAGGGSDFSTAEVTITNAGNGILIACAEMDGSIGGIFEAVTINAILYKGVAIAEGVDEEDLVINTGSAEYLIPDSTRLVKITGNCSIGVANT